MGWKDDPVVGGWQNDPIVEEKKRPTIDDPGFAQSALIGAGRTTDRVLQGIKQAGLQVGSLLPEDFGGAASREALTAQQARMADDDAQYKKLQDIRPGATMLGEVAPMLAMPMLGTGIRGAAMSASVPGLVEYGTPEEKLMRGGVGAAGGAVGGAVGKAFARAPQPFKLPESETLAASRAAADRLGVQLRPDEVIKSKPLAWLQTSLNDLPLAGGMAQTQENARRQALNAAANRSIGQGGNEVTESALANARTAIGSTFDRLLQGREIPLDNSFRAEVKAITGSKVMKSLRNEETDAIIAPFANMPAGNIKVTGEWFQQNKTALDSVIRSAYNAGENGKARALEQFEKALERAAARSMSGDERAAYQAAQKQWASLRLLETGKVVEGGNVMPGRLDSALTTRYKEAYKEGRLTGELPDIGRLAQSYKPLPQSGTTPRAIYSGLAGGAMFAEPMSAAAMLAAPAAVQKFLQSKIGHKYLTQGLLDVSPEVEKWLIRSGGLLGLPATALASQ